MLRLIFLIFTFVSCSWCLGFAEQPVLKLVYKDIGKPPYMETAPDNSGLYYDMMSRVVEKIGYKLVVLRLPKKRTYHLLETGEADLYASAVYKDFRAIFLYYLPNGLHRQEVYYGLTSINIPEIKNVKEINKYNLTWFVELGSSNVLDAQRYDVDYLETKDIGIDMAMKLITGKRRCFYRVLQADIGKYMNRMKITSMKEVGIRLHGKCFKRLEKPLYTGFSRRSPHYSEQPNLLFDDTKPVSVENFPVEAVPDSVPDKLEKAFQEMIDSGDIAALERKYLED